MRELNERQAKGPSLAWPGLAQPSPGRFFWHAHTRTKRPAHIRGRLPILDRSFVVYYMYSLRLWWVRWNILFPIPLNFGKRVTNFSYEKGILIMSRPATGPGVGMAFSTASPPPSLSPLDLDSGSNCLTQLELELELSLVSLVGQGERTWALTCAWDGGTILKVGTC